MKLRRRISLIKKYLKKRDIQYFRKDLKQFVKLISEMQKDNPNASIIDCIDKYNSSLEKLIYATHKVRYGDFFLYLVTEILFRSKEKNRILREQNSKININALGKSVDFNGNVNHDFESIVKLYFQEQVKRYENLSKMLREQPDNVEIRKEMNRLAEMFEKIKTRKLSAYEMTKLENEQISTFDGWRRKFKSQLQNELASSIIKKIVFLKRIGCLDEYEDAYNKAIDNNHLPSILRVKDRTVFEKELIDFNKLRNYSVSELVAINAFWTNKLVKEVEKWNEVIYVIVNSNNFKAFKDGERLKIEEKDIIHYLSEYRGIIPYITEYKHSKKATENAIHSGQNEKALMSVNCDVGRVFSKEDIDDYGYRDLNAILQQVVALNDRSQLLYDQKDIAIEEILGIILNTNEYGNAGISIENAKSAKPMIMVDLKGFNGPIMLHTDMRSIKKRVNIIRGKPRMPV